jgi:hypothetical protein
MATAKAMADTVKRVLLLFRHTFRQAILRKILIVKISEEKDYPIRLKFLLVKIEGSIFMLN